MKLALKIILLVHMACCNTLGEEAQSGEMKRLCETLVSQFEALPDEQAFAFWSNHIDPVAGNTAMLESALEHDRIAFLKKVFADRAGNDWLTHVVERMPDSNAKDRVLIELLRWESPYWGNGDGNSDRIASALIRTRPRSIEQ